MSYRSRIGCFDVVLQEVTKPSVSHLLMRDEEVLKV